MKYKIGQKVRVLPGFTGKRSPGVNTSIFNNKYALTVKEIDVYESDINVYFFQEVLNGIYEFALISVEEIREKNLNKILNE